MLRHVLAWFLLSVAVVAVAAEPGNGGPEKVTALGQDSVDLAAGGPQTKFAVAEIVAALNAKGQTGHTAIGPFVLLPQGRPWIMLSEAAEGSLKLAAVFHVEPLKKDAPPQSYAIRKATVGGQTTFLVLAADPVGAMYGGLDIAEAIRLGTLGDLKDSDHSPHIAQRGIKFNITPDRRTPTYSDASDSAQANIPEMWSMAFWHEYFDEMARRRLNVLSLWNLHPFPSIVKVPEYPDVALSDVWGSQEGKVQYDFNMDSPTMAKPFQLRDVAIVNRMTIDEKIKFWREVMQAAKDRGIDVYWFTWNTFVWGTEGKYGLTEDGNNPTTIAYFRASVRETVKTYPLLAGIGITAGENMKSSRGAFDHEAWLWQTYGEGIRDALKDQPGRNFRFIHRFHQTGQTQHPQCVQGLSRHDGFQLQVLGRPHVFRDQATVHRRPAQGDGAQDADLAHGPQRRHLQLPLGRSRLRPRVYPQHARP